MSLLDYFQPASSDQSIALLSVMFGGLSSIPGSPGILASMFKTFNSIVLVIGLFVVAYVVVIGVITTAHEGEFLGKKFHSLWTPIRMVIGIASLIPTASGYSGLQVIIMWSIIQGIGAADAVWSTALIYTQQYGNIFATSPTLAVGVTPTLQQLFGGLVCAASTSIQNTAVNSNVTNQWNAKSQAFTGFASNAPPATVTNQCSGDTCTLSFNDSTRCGTLTYGNPQAGATATGITSQPTTTQLINAAQQVVLIGTDNLDVANNNNNKFTLEFNENPISIIDQLYYLAYIFAQSDVQYLNFYYNSPTNASNDNNAALIPTYTSTAPYGYSAQQMPWGFISEYCINQSISGCCVPLQSPSSSLSSCATSSYSWPATDTNTNVPTDASTEAAALYLAGDIQPSALNNPVFSNSSLPNSIAKLSGVNFLNAIFNNLSAQYAQAVQAAIPPPPTTATGTLSTIQNYGWIFAGGYYYYLSTYNGTAVKSANPPFTFYIDTSANELSTLRYNYSASQGLFNPVGSNPNTAGMSNVASATTGTVISTFMQNLTGGKPGSLLGPASGSSNQIYVNPLVRLQSFGQQLLVTVEVSYPFILAVNALLGTASALASMMVIGTGVASGAYPALSVINAFVLPLFLGMYGIMLSIGGLLAVYTPLVPYIIFTMCAIGWFISIIEAMVAAPLVAIGILSPSAQHHEILGKAEGALMTVFSLIMRPSLMIFGLIASMLLASMSVALINATFEEVMMDIVHAQLDAAGNHTQDYVDFLELIFFMSAYLFLVLSALNKCFSLIAILPGKVMSWIGGQAEGADTEAQQEVKGAVGSAGGKAHGGAAGSLDMGVSKAGSAAQEEKATGLQAEEERKKRKGEAHSTAEKDGKKDDKTGGGDKKSGLT